MEDTNKMRNIFLSPYVVYEYLKMKYDLKYCILTALFKNKNIHSHIVTDENIKGIAATFEDYVLKNNVNLDNMFFSIKYIKDGKEKYETFDQTNYLVQRKEIKSLWDNYLVQSKESKFFLDNSWNHAIKVVQNNGFVPFLASSLKIDVVL